MGRPTPEEAKEMQYRKLIKEIWEKDYNRKKDEFTVISLGEQFMKIKTGEKGIDIHRSLFEDYFTAANVELKIGSLTNIKNYLKQLL